MLKKPFSALLAASAMLAIASAGADPVSATPYMTITRLGMSTTEFRCVVAMGADCHYRLLTSLCQEKMLDNGTKERTCRYTEPVPAFKLGAGEKRTVTNLPSDFLSMMKPGATPSYDEVVRSAPPR
jgi:acyl-coenzyme A synthetase/AMP-(fatty) acid ligase